MSNLANLIRKYVRGRLVKCDDGVTRTVEATAISTETSGCESANAGQARFALTVNYTDGTSETRYS